jgi:hypothetical protein
MQLNRAAIRANSLDQGVLVRDWHCHPPKLSSRDRHLGRHSAGSTEDIVVASCASGKLRDCGAV